MYDISLGFCGGCEDHLFVWQAVVLAWFLLNWILRPATRLLTVLLLLARVVTASDHVVDVQSTCHTLMDHDSFPQINFADYLLGTDMLLDTFMMLFILNK